MINIPPAFFCSAALIFTNTLSPNGFNRKSNKWKKWFYTGRLMLIVWSLSLYFKNEDEYMASYMQKLKLLASFCLNTKYKISLNAKSNPWFHETQEIKKYFFPHDHTYLNKLKDWHISTLVTMVALASLTTFPKPRDTSPIPSSEDLDTYLLWWK